MKTPLVAFFLFCAFFACAQGNSIDSLIKVISVSKEDTLKVNTYLALVRELRLNKPDTAFYLANQALTLSKKLNYEMGNADLKRIIGALYADKGKYDEGLKSANEALILYKKLLASAPETDKEIILKKIGSTYNVLGHNSISKSNYNEGLRYSFLALGIREKIGDKKGISDTEFNIGNIYSSQRNYPEALKHYYASLKLSEQLGIKSDIADNINVIGLVHSELGNYEEAINCYSRALELAIETKNKVTLAEIYNNLGAINYLKENYTEALSNNFKALKLFEEIGVSEQIAFICSSIGVVYTKQKNYRNASAYLKKALSISKDIGKLDYIKLSYENWAALDSAQGNFKASLEHYKLAIKYRDSIFNEGNTKKLVQQQMQYDFDKKEAAIKAEQDKKHALAAAEIQRQKIVRNFSFAGIFIVLIAGGYGFYRFRKNKQMENQQALLNERLRISRELHDDMGSTLSSISVYSEVAKNRASKNENETEVLQKIGNASRELIDKMSDIVWSLNPNNENFEQLKNRMMAFAAMMLTPKGILFEFDIDEEVKSTAIAPEQRKNVFLIYKEAINNIVKYSEATSVKVSMKVKENKLNLAIIDNGVGFDSLSFADGRGEVYNGNGLKNMKTRAEEIKAFFNVTSRIKEGTSIELSFSI